MESLKIPNEKARELAECDSGSDVRFYFGLPLDVIENRDHSEQRWTMTMELVVRDDDGNLFRAFYQRGLTENQDTRPFEYDGDEIEFKPVTRKVVERYVYEAA